ncbi:MAG: hypothetical protein NWF07_05165 [Candidatus Bathyarchaeota archaeon]|nr:hypothetical protein [Candidatus Bathyarchaeota archaeon]
MSEQISTLELIAYVIGIIPSVYFAYRLLVELYYYLTKKEDDFL